MLRRFRRMLDGRRYRDAAYARPDLRRRTEANSWERLMRIVRRREVFGYDEREARAGNNLRRVVGWVVMVFVIWFVTRSVMALNIFAG